MTQTNKSESSRVERKRPIRSLAMQYERRMVKWVDGKKNIFSKLRIMTCAGCSQAYWGREMLKRSGKPGYCRDCWHEKTGRWIHEDIRLLNDEEKNMLQEYFKITGVTIKQSDRGDEPHGET